MNIERLPSGSYRIRQQIDGTRYRVTVDHKPTTREAMQLIMQAANKGPERQNMASGASFSVYAEKYIDSRKKNGRSVSTIDNYESIARNLPEELMDSNIFQLTGKQMQKYIDLYAYGRSYKSVNNAIGFVSSVMKEFRDDFTATIKNNATRSNKRAYEPTTKEVMAILDMAKGTRYESALHLAVLGLRRGELIAVTPDDISQDNVLTINKALALGSDNKYHEKTTKTDASVRSIPIPPELADLIRKQGCVFNGNPHTINETLHKYQDKLGIERFTLHTLRHFAAAYLHKLGYSDASIMEWCGWQRGSDVMQRIYRYNLDPAETKRSMSDAFSRLI